jgi:hypothetical protein
MLIPSLAITFMLELRIHVKKSRMKSWPGTIRKSYLWKTKKKEIKRRKIQKRSWRWWRRNSKKKRGEGQDIVRRRSDGACSYTNNYFSAFPLRFPVFVLLQELLPRIPKPFWVYRRRDAVAKMPNSVDYVSGQYTRTLTEYQHGIHNFGEGLTRLKTPALVIS